ncbi:hypothetical protein CKO27_06660 [Thiocystis violacea]|nr:hypothetical protein [Thiocystis violacea]
MEAIAQAARHARANHCHLILAGVKPGTYGTLERAGLVREMGADAIFQHEPMLLAATLKALDSAHARVCEDQTDRLRLTDGTFDRARQPRPFASDGQRHGGNP